VHERALAQIFMDHLAYEPIPADLQRRLQQRVLSEVDITLARVGATSAAHTTHWLSFLVRLALR